MAVVTEMEQISGVMPPPNGTEPPKRKGRPPGSRNKVEEVLVDDDPSVDAHLKTHKEDIWATVANVSDWTYEFAYLYRLSPTIDRRSAGRQINIDKFACAFDPEDIKKKHGSGCYRICLFHIDPASNKYFKYRDEKIDILDMDYPPNVPPGDWVNEPANEVWKWAAPKIQAAAATNPVGPSLKEVYDTAFQMAKQMTPPHPPAKDDSALITLLTSLVNRPAPAAPPPPDDTASKALFAYLEKQNDRLAEELKELRNKATAPPPQKNLLEQIKEIQPALLAAKELMGDSKPGSWWEGPLQTLMEGAAEAIPAVVQMVQSGKPSPAPHAWTPPQGQPQALSAAPPPQLPPTQATSAATAPEPNPNLTEAQRTLAQLFSKWGMFVVHIAPQMIERFKDPDGLGGLYFRDWFLEGHGMFKWADMRRELGPGVLGQMIAEHPQLSVEIAPEEQRKGFLEQFFTLPVDEDEEQVPGDGVIEIGGDNAA